jgi:crotonobetainyl-CoA:carnitine CoA-transferase CaiB-like acyl-CoA transferase
MRPDFAVTSDGVWIQFANTMDHLCVAQMTALGLLDLYGDERFAKLPAVFTEDDADALWGIVLERVRSKTYDEWSAIFAQYEDLAVERVRGPLESLRHPQIVHNGQAVQVRALDRTLTTQPGPIALLSANTAAIGPRAPHLDEHTDAAFPPRSSPDTATGPASAAPALAGITILDFSAWIAAPLATTMLANLGARVFKIEQVGGDVSRYSTGGLLSFPMTQGKQSIALDLKRPQGLEVARKLIARADMLVHNYRAGVAQRIGIDYETCRALNPRLIYLDAASYGSDGPDCRKPAFFAIAAAIGGNQLRQVGAGHPVPGIEQAPIEQLKAEAWRLLKAAEGNADPIAALGAAAGLMLALHARDETGEGQALTTTMIGSTLYANSDEAIDFEGRPPSPQVDEALYGLGPAYRLYEAAEGWLFLACHRRAEWEALCNAIGLGDLAHEWVAAWSPATAEGRAIAAQLEALFRTRSADDWERTLVAQAVPIASVEMRDPGRFNMQDPDLRAQGHAVQATSPVHGAYWRHGALVRFGDDGAQTFGPWEPLGGHTRSILAELGYDEDTVAQLLDARVVESWAPEAALT